MAWLEMRDYTDRAMIVYLIRNTINGKCYVGQTTQTLQRRLNTHKTKAKSGSTSPLYCAIRKYGWDSFEVSVLTVVDNLEALNEAERKYVAEYRSTDREFGYNLAEGGNSNSGWVMREETKLRIGQSNRGKPGRKGIALSEEHRRKLGDARRGMKFSEEWLRNMSVAKRGMKHGSPSEETRRKISAALIGHPPFVGSGRPKACHA
jgi:group I intron endonuclease